MNGYFAEVMPRSLPTYCTEPGCGALTRGSKCAKHERARRLRRKRPKTAARGFGSAWQRLRKQVLAEEPRCRLCGRASTEVDHIVATRKGGTSDRSNLRALCKPCHSRKTVKEDGGFRMSRKKQPPTKETPIEARSSFIPEPEKPPEPEATEAPTLRGDFSRMITIEVHRGNDRNVEVRLTIPPLKTCVERVFLPGKASDEQIASITAGAIKRAAASAESDGVFQHATREQEERESKDRFAANR